MYLPGLTAATKSRDYNIEFKGYNHNLYVGAGQFYDMKNLTSRFYPVLAPRSKRGKIRKIGKPNGFYAKNKLCWVDGTTFYYNGVERGQVKDEPKQFVGMGAYVLIFPDKLMFNTSDQTVNNALTPLETSYTASSTIVYKLARGDGTAYEESDYVSSSVAPTSPKNGTLWMDTSASTTVMRVYSESSGVWQPMATTYIKVEAPGIGQPFAAGDGVHVEGSTLSTLNGVNVIISRGNDYLVFTGILSALTAQNGGLTVSRRVPEMDYMVEWNNRIWGCSSAKHEIYACKLGDPTNWYLYSAQANASYAVTVGTDGDFTGACAIAGSIFFFKEDTIHQVMGTKPADFQLDITRLHGVEKGSERSVVQLNESLIYKGREGVYQFEGGVPVEISRDLGTGRFHDAVAGVLGSRYYLSMADELGAWHLFVFDSDSGMWHREDDTHVKYFANVDGELYFVDAGGWLFSVGGTIDRYQEINADQEIITVPSLEGDVEWMAETGDIGMELPDHKYVSKLQFRVSVDDGAELHVSVCYDSNDNWLDKGVVGPTARKSVTLPIIPARCDHMRVRLVGKGSVRLYAISKAIEQGSEL